MFFLLTGVHQLFQNDHAHAIGNVATEEDVSGQGVATGNIEKEAETEIESVTGNAIVKGRGIVIVTGNVITVNHIHGRDHEAGRGIVNVKEIGNIESEAEKKGKLNISYNYFNWMYLLIQFSQELTDNYSL